MAKLYPPTIAGTIPAFYGTSIEVPFFMNRAVGLFDFTGFALKIKKVNGSLIGTVFAENTSPWVEDGVVVFNLPEYITEKLLPGNFYKIQLAYTKNISATGRDIGIYSTVGIIKYTTLPLITIEGLDEHVVNTHIYSYTGVYRQAEQKENNKQIYYEWSTKDTEEKLYSSRFVIYDSNHNIVKDSGELIHNILTDTNIYEASETFLISDSFELNKIYYLYYIVTTVNGLVKSSPRYRITQRKQIPMSMEGSIEAKMNPDSGTVKIYLKGAKKNQVSSGSFLLSRRNVNGSGEWEELYYFTLQSEIPDRLLFVDYTAFQGVEYVYSLQQYNTNQIYSDRIYSNCLKVDFEDLFLYDGERQLKIKFNPKVATFKPNVIETKTNTLGSKHPFISRNGKVNYKEFSISGLISHQMDDMELFLTKDSLGLEFLSSNLTSENIKAEREFKLAALEWLNNGKAKLFRSPTEGNYIVRLMNVTMSPTDTLGRMLHTFSCSAYEIDDYTYLNLRKHGLITANDKMQFQMRWASVRLANTNENGMVEYFTGQVNESSYYGEKVVRPIYTLQVSEMMPGTYFLIGDTKETAKKVVIGATGSYELFAEKPYAYVGIPENDDYGNPVQWDGLFTYGYKTQVTSLFDLITKVEINDIPCYRIIGNTGDSLISDLQDIKTSILAIRYLSFSIRSQYPLYTDPETFELIKSGAFDIRYPETYHFYADSNNATYYKNNVDFPSESQQALSDKEVSLYGLDEWNIYKIYLRREDYSNWTPQDNHGSPNPTGEGYYVDRHGEYFTPFTGFYFDPISRTMCPEEGIFTININGEEADLTETEKLYITGIENYEVLKAGAGVVTDIGYQNQTSTYTFELTHGSVVSLKKTYLDMLDTYLKNRTVQSASSNGVKQAYKNFIEELNAVITSYKEENDID